MENAQNRESQDDPQTNLTEASGTEKTLTPLSIPLKPDNSSDEKPRLSIPPPPSTPPPEKAKERYHHSRSSSLNIALTAPASEDSHGPPEPSAQAVDTKRKSLDGALRSFVSGAVNGSKPGSPLMSMFTSRRRSRSREAAQTAERAPGQQSSLAPDSNPTPTFTNGTHETDAANSSASHKDEDKSAATRTASQPLAFTTEKMSEAADSALKVVQHLISNPIIVAPNPEEIPPIRLPPTVPIIVSIEESSEVGAYLDQFRSTVGGIGWVREANRLDECIPKWVYDGIIESKTLLKDPAKMSFVLLPHLGSGLPELPNNTNRLVSNRMLRIRKLLNYVADNVQMDPPVELVRAAIRDLESAAQGPSIDEMTAALLQQLRCWGNEKANAQERAVADKAARSLGNVQEVENFNSSKGTAPEDDNRNCSTSPVEVIWGFDFDV
ncbi:hypothetical protein HDU96_011022 [Phlyctochytrium bullatum]|nr:hypothetical protein HDU96_011022 [Phlyctochytrium bullatum]